MQRARAVQSIDYPAGEWRNKNGRPSVEGVIRAYLLEHPTASKAEVIRGTGKDKKTVYKYYEAAKQDAAALVGGKTAEAPPNAHGEDV